MFEGSVWDLKMRENPGHVMAMLKKDVPLKKLGKFSVKNSLVTSAPLAKFFCAASL